MSRLRQWLAAGGLLIIIGTTAMLGNWQLNRADEKRRLALHQVELRAMPPLNLDGGVLWQSPAEDLPAGSLTGDTLSVKAVARGRWLPAGTIFIDNRTHQGVSGFHVLTPLVLDTKPGQSPYHVLVLRGWVPVNAQNRNKLPDIVYPPAPVQVSGETETALAQSMQLGQEPQPGSEQRLWQYFDLKKYQTWSGLRLQPIVLRQISESDDSLIREWQQPGDGVDRHLGYAFQWFAMCAAAVLFALWRLLAPRLRRTRLGH